MCTAITYKTKDSYFGRNLDLEYSYEETVTITPRNYPFRFRKLPEIRTHYAIIGMAYVSEGYPLYYDATNEKGLSMAGLNFPDNAYYHKEDSTKFNVSPFEFIPYILSGFKTVKEVRAHLKNINLVNINFSDKLKLTPLHWIISDKYESVTVESVKDGLKVYDNRVGVLTNSPSFDVQMFNLNNYMHLSTKEPVNTFLPSLNAYSRGMGALGLPGDASSMSRFVKAVFTKHYSISENTEEKSINQFFHILSSVEQQRGCVIVGKKCEITQYSSCCNSDRGIYYYKTYDNSRITAVDMHKENLEGQTLISYPLIKTQSILFQN